MMRKLMFALVIAFGAAECLAAEKAESRGPIDRLAIVNRNNVILKRHDPANPLQVGNGEFAFAADVTGLQTFTDKLGTYSQWGWHTFPNPERYREEETFAVIEGGGRKVPYACGVRSGTLTTEQKARAEGAFNWYRRSPHRLHLGRIGFELLKADGKAAEPKDLKAIRQSLKLWNGQLKSSFKLDGVPVEVITCCHPNLDLIAVQVRSDLLSTGRLKVFLHFPYMDFAQCQPTWDPQTDACHETQVKRLRAGRADLQRTLDSDHYAVSVAWSEGQWARTGPHRFTVTPVPGTKEFQFVCGFGPEPAGELPDFIRTAATATGYWRKFWQSGGAIDLSASKDPRWRELERRIVLSQYLTAVNSAGSAPPQESCLFSNSWYGKFHLEMTAWHGVHFVLWDRPSLVAGWMDWFRGPGLQAARRQAAKQGYQGARWMKMIGPDPQWESPSGAGPFRMTQQGHAIYWAELMHRERPGRQTLEQFKDLVLQSAEFMADYVWFDKGADRYVLGPPLLSGSEHTSPYTSFNSTVELSYWFYGLRTAQLWRERLGLAREPRWEAVLAKLSKPPIYKGICGDTENNPRSGGRPAWLEAYGCMRGDEIDPAAMGRFLDTVLRDVKNGSKKWGIWGCDYPMMAMTAARLGRPEDAVNCLLMETPRNAYLANGFNNSGSRPYLPASGGLLWAVAMMAAGWEGCPDQNAPGFPNDGSWVVKWEGLRKTP